MVAKKTDGPICSEADGKHPDGMTSAAQSLGSIHGAGYLFPAIVTWPDGDGVAP